MHFEISYELQNSGLSIIDYIALINWLLPILFRILVKISNSEPKEENEDTTVS